jgi:transcriptional regulator with XRE-family HTH domain
MKTDKEFKPSLIELGEKIYHLRILKRFTPKEIAPKLNLSTVAYRNIEKGNCDLSYTKLLHLAEILQIDISELVRMSEISHGAAELRIVPMPKNEMERKKIIKHRI